MNYRIRAAVLIGLSLILLFNYLFAGGFSAKESTRESRRELLGEIDSGEIGKLIFEEGDAIAGEKRRFLLIEGEGIYEADDITDFLFLPHNHWADLSIIPRDLERKEITAFAYTFIESGKSESYRMPTENEEVKRIIDELFFLEGNVFIGRQGTREQKPLLRFGLESARGAQEDLWIYAYKGAYAAGTTRRLLFGLEKSRMERVLRLLKR